MSDIRLFVEPKTVPKSWKQFLKEAPKHSIALDGYVKDATLFERNKVMQNFNHHENVDRLSTRSTCAQVLNAIRLNFFDSFRNDKGTIEMNIFVNDCDEDVCLSVFLLRHGFMAEHVISPNLNKLVNCEDALDTTSGAYPFPKDMPMLQELAWVFEPYRRVRKLGLLGTKDASLYEGIIEDVGNRIMQYITGNGKTLELDTNYEVIDGGKNWSMVREIGEYARTGMFSDGIYSFVSVNQRNDTTWDYIIGKHSPYVDFDIESIFQALNQEEGKKDDLWGGSDIIGGSPRVSGSHLSPNMVKRIIEEITQSHFSKTPV